MEYVCKDCKKTLPPPPDTITITCICGKCPEDDEFYCDECLKKKIKELNDRSI